MNHAHRRSTHGHRRGAWVAASAVALGLAASVGLQFAGHADGALGAAPVATSSSAPAECGATIVL